MDECGASGSYWLAMWSWESSVMCRPRNLELFAILTVVPLYAVVNCLLGSSQSQQSSLWSLQPWEIIVSAPFCEMLHFLPVCWLVIVVDEGHKYSIISKHDDMISTIYCSTVLSQQGNQQWTEHTAPGSTGVQCGSTGDATNPEWLRSPRQKVQNLVADV